MLLKATRWVDLKDKEIFNFHKLSRCHHSSQGLLVTIPANVCRKNLYLNIFMGMFPDKFHTVKLSIY